MHVPTSPVLADRVAAAAAAGDGIPEQASAAGMHSCLWPPCFQWTFWHAAEQYLTTLHLAQRCSPGLAHPSLAHLVGVAPLSFRLHGGARAVRG
jgi:hypothetical protein